MQSLYDIAAPAKINLFLHITGRRPDGYHLLQSVFILIDWCDHLHFDLRRDGLISREDLTWELPADDLTLRAGRALQKATGCTLGAHIGVSKSVPAQAGMGGGSSDAASTLLALNVLWDLHLPRAELARIGLALGADVPFFLLGKNAWVQGIGDQLTPVDVPRARFLIAKPDAGLDTQRIFSDPDLQRHTELAIISGFAADPFGFGRNDLQPVAEKLCPGVGQALAWFSDKGLRARMTGSGSAVFAYLHHAIDTQDAPGAMVLKACSSLEAHPLLGWS
ncbi:MAG: 4-(cytidine 5'-diphospho)-2-C-methyl-D-erythritol kinase [Betaproteobacteria bacterium]